MIALLMLALAGLRCAVACDQLIDLGCFNGAAGVEHARCTMTCLQSPLLPVSCVRSAASCEEAAQCGAEP